jgi:hypothetical protein
VPEISDLDIVDANNTARFPEGMQGSAINNGARALEGLLARWYEDTDGSIASGGSSNAYTLTSKRTISGLVDATIMAFTANHTNTGASTLALNGLTAKAIRRPNGDALVAGDIVSGQVCIVIYKSSPDQWRLLSGPGAAGVVPARAYSTYATNTDLTTELPYDNSIPQNTEGTEIISQAITLKRADSRVRARFTAHGLSVSSAGDDGRPWSAALFIDSTADALAAAAAGDVTQNQFSTSAGGANVLVLEFEHAPGSVGPFTYKIRVGPTSGDTLRLNGNPAGRKFGGVSVATLVLEEVYV